MVDRIREQLGRWEKFATGEVHPTEPERLTEMWLLCQAFAHYSERHAALLESLQDGSVTEALRLADEMGVAENGHNLNAPTLRLLVRAALKVEI